MRVSLVTTVKNEAETLGALIAAVDEQHRQPDEWIVVDGGSTDGSAAILRRSGRCRVLEERGNIARGRNRAIAAATSPIIATLDAGCRPRPDWLERLVAPLETQGAQIAAGATEPRIDRPLDAAQAALLDQFVLPGRGPRQAAISARSLAFRVDVWRTHPFPEWLDHGEDTWAVRRWLEHEVKMERVAAAVVEWNLRSSPIGFLRQLYLYMRGDGLASMNAGRHALRFLFYLGAGAALFVRTPPSGSIALAAVLLYAAASAARLRITTRGRGVAFRLRSLGWLLLLLPTMDAAKIAGYLAGRVARLRGRAKP